MESKKATLVLGCGHECGPEQVTQGMIGSIDDQNTKIIVKRLDMRLCGPLLLSGNRAGEYACPTCFQLHTIANESAAKQLLKDPHRLMGTPLLGWVHFGEEDGQDWTYHLTDKNQLDKFVPAQLFNSSESDVFKKIDRIKHILKTRQLPHFHIVGCPCQEWRCCGFLLFEQSECLHCAKKDYARTFLEKHNLAHKIPQLEKLALLTPSQFQSILSFDPKLIKKNK